MNTIYTRDQATAAIKKAFETTRALKLNQSDHLANLVVEVYHKLPEGLGQRGTLAAFIDGYCAAARHAMEAHEMDFVHMVNGVLYGGVGSDGFKRPSVDKVAHLDPSKIEVAYLWRHTEDQTWTGWFKLEDHMPKVQP